MERWDRALLRYRFHMLWDIAVLSMAGIWKARCNKLNPAHIKSGPKTDISTQKTSLVRARKVTEAVEYYALETSIVWKVSALIAISFKASQAIEMRCGPGFENLFTEIIIKKKLKSVLVARSARNWINVLK